MTAPAASEMKVVFTDKYNHLQYESSAAVVYKHPDTNANLFIGDQSSCSMVQLQHRSMSKVIIAQSDMHGLAKQEKVQYCKIDPMENERICLDLSERFIDQALDGSCDVLVCCQTGLGRSACIILNYLMKKINISLADAHKRLILCRNGVNTESKTSGFRPELLNLLIFEENNTRGSCTISLKGRKMLYTEPIEFFPLLPISSKNTLKLCKNLDCNDAPIPTVFIASYPKSGTTWTQSIVYHLLAHTNQQLHDARPEGLSHISDYCPFYEVDGTWSHHTIEGEIGNNTLKPLVRENHDLLQHRIFNTHLLPDMLPPICSSSSSSSSSSSAYLTTNIKMIYITRNAKDAVYSFYHHLSNQDEGSGGTGTLFPNFDEFVRQWLNNQIPYGRWHRHVVTWLNLCNDNKNILLINYEEMIHDLGSQLVRINSFLGLNDLNSIDIENLKLKLTFHGMKSNEKIYSPISVKWKNGYSFIRKGEIGDSMNSWKELPEKIEKDFIDNSRKYIELLTNEEHKEIFRALSAPTSTST
jgi:hypothetical protein